MDEIRRAVARASEREAAGHIDQRIPNIIKTKLFRYLDPNVLHDKEAIFILDYWITEENPMESILADPEFLSAFERVFNKYKTRTVERKTYYRGTTNKNRMNMQIGDILDYTSRYTSWSGEKSVASNFNSPATNNIVLKYTSAGEESVHLFTQEDEYILKPHKFKIIDIQYEKSLESGLMEKIYILSSEEDKMTLKGLSVEADNPPLQMLSSEEDKPFSKKINAVPSYFSHIIAKLNPSVNILDVNKQSNGRKDIYNLMCCNSAMKNVFFDDDFMRLVLNFSYPEGVRGIGSALPIRQSAVDKFQKNLSNSEYYALLNRTDDEWISVQWVYLLNTNKSETSEIYNSFNFELLTNFVGSSNGIVKKYIVQYLNYNAITGNRYFTITHAMKKISEMPKIIAFLLLNKINIDPRNKNVTVNHMQWMLDNGFLISSRIREQILQSFDLTKLKFFLAIPSRFKSKKYKVPGFFGSDSTSNSDSTGRVGFLEEELRLLYAGPADGKTILSEKDHRDFLTYLYSIANLPFDFFSNEIYINFSYDIIYSLDPKKFDNFVHNLLEVATSISSRVKLVQWAVLHKLKILKTDVSRFYYGGSEYQETFMYLINAGYLPEKATIYDILRSEDFTVLDILKKNGADFSFGTRPVSPNVKAWLAKNNK